MSLVEDIAAYVAKAPGSRARDIAIALGVERRDVNSLLYREVMRRFRIDPDYRWYLVCRDDSVSPEEPLLVPQEQVVSAVCLERPTPTTLDMLRARCNLARLKRGVPPTDGIDALAIGMNRLSKRIDLVLSSEPAQRWFAVTGEYGEGKSFFRAYACRRAAGE